jgi:hypothetical protein
MSGSADHYRAAETAWMLLKKRLPKAGGLFCLTMKTRLVAMRRQTIGRWEDRDILPFMERSLQSFKIPLIRA